MTAPEPPEKPQEKTPVTDYHIWADHASDAGAAPGILDKMPEERRIERRGMEHQVKKRQAKLGEMIRPERWPQQLVFQLRTPDDTRNVTAPDMTGLAARITHAVDELVKSGHPRTSLLLTELQTRPAEAHGRCQLSMTLEEHTPFDLLTTDNLPMTDAYNRLIAAIDETASSGPATKQMQRLLTFLSKRRMQMRVVLTQAGQVVNETRCDNYQQFRNAVDALTR